MPHDFGRIEDAGFDHIGELALLGIGLAGGSLSSALIA
jgi:hypothetical protein